MRVELTGDIVNAIDKYYLEHSNEYPTRIDCLDEYFENEEFRNKINDLYNLTNQ